MKKLLIAICSLVIAFALVCGGYIAGQKNQLSSITSALPRETIENTNSPENSVIPHKDDNVPPAVAPEVMQPERNIIEQNSSSAIQSGWTEVKKMSPVVISKSDDIKADVMLYTSAEKDTDGEFIWDDGNQWVLEVNTGNEYYTLINKYVQLGRVDVMVGADENGECVITAVTSTGSGLVVEKYTYNGTAFEGQAVYNSGALNVWGSTF